MSGAGLVITGFVDGEERKIDGEQYMKIGVELTQAGLSLSILLWVPVARILNPDEAVPGRRAKVVVEPGTTIYQTVYQPFDVPNPERGIPSDWALEDFALLHDMLPVLETRAIPAS